jgi:anti-sigma factor RsiW
MKRCQDAVPLLGPLFDDALPDDDRAWVEEHLAGCQACRDRLALLAAQGEALRETLSARAAAVDFAGFSQRVMDRIAREPQPRTSVPVWFSEMWHAHRAAITAAGSMVAAACLALGVWLAPRPPPEEPQYLADASPQVEEVDFGSHDGAVLELKDQTPVIWLADDHAGAPQ